VSYPADWNWADDEFDVVCPDCSLCPTCGKCSHVTRDENDEYRCRAPVPMFVDAFRADPTVDPEQPAADCPCFTRGEKP